MPQIIEGPQISLDSNYGSYIDQLDIDYAGFRDFYRDLDVDKNRQLNDVSVFLSSLALVDSNGEIILAGRPNNSLNGEILDPLTPEKTDIIIFLGSCVNTGCDPAYVLGSELATVVSAEVPDDQKKTIEPPLSVNDYDKMTAISRLRLRTLTRTGIIFGAFLGLKDFETSTHHDVPYSVEDIGLQAIVLSTIVGLILRSGRKNNLADMFNASTGPYAEQLTTKPLTITNLTMSKETIILSTRPGSSSPDVRTLGVDSPRLDSIRQPIIIQLSE
jgi:hypothetical protein